MTDARPFAIRQLARRDVAEMESLLSLFEAVFEETDAYSAARPSKSYLERLLGREHFLALVAEKDGALVGGLTAYELTKYEQERSEIYVYDLAVAATHRRQGVATALLEALKSIARERGAYVILIQSDWADEAPVALYGKLGRQTDIHHFEIAVD